MKQHLKNHYKRFICFTAAIAMSLNTAVAAASFSDVPSTHWAHSAISSIADLGYMVGDDTGNYKPNLIIDRFYAAKVMAKYAGYKSAGYTATEKAEQDAAYEKHKASLAAMKTKYSKWDTTADKELAYLLEKGIMTAADLDRFVISSNGAESLRGLSKEDAAVFIVRMMGHEAEMLANAQATWNLYADDASITADKKPSVYYLKKIGVLSAGADNIFSPRNNVTKAVFATMLNSARTHTGATATGNTANANFAGKIVELYPSRYAVQVEAADGQKSIHNVAQGTSITIDGAVKSFADLEAGMTFTAVLANDAFSNIIALSGKAVQPSVQPPVQPPVQPEQPTTQPPSTSNPTTTPSYPTATMPDMPMQKIEGTVKNVNTTQKTISIEVKLIGSSGAIYTEERIFALASNCKISRGTETVNLSSISSGDIVTLEIAGTTVYSIAAQVANMSFTGVLKEKIGATNSLTAQYIITDSSGKDFELNVAANTSIERDGRYNLKWSDLKLGDTVTLKTNYNTIDSIIAQGTRTTTEGVIKEIHLYDNNIGTVVFIESLTNTEKEYGLNTATVDVYSLRVGDKLRLRLDSWEIDSYTKLEISSTQSVTGEVSSLKSTSFSIKPFSSGSTTTIHFDANTYVYNAVTREPATVGSIKNGMELFVTYQHGSSNYATAITILSE